MDQFTEKLVISSITPRPALAVARLARDTKSGFWPTSRAGSSPVIAIRAAPLRKAAPMPSDSQPAAVSKLSGAPCSNRALVHSASANSGVTSEAPAR
jgi:hypothetical protein